MSASSSGLHSVVRLSFVSLLLLSACAPFGAGGTAGVTFNLPSTTKGSLAFTPRDGAVELDPARTEIVVRTVSSDAHLTSVKVQQDGGPVIDGSIKKGQVNIKIKKEIKK